MKEGHAYREPRAYDRHHGEPIEGVMINLDSHGHKPYPIAIDNIPGTFILESAIHGFGLWTGHDIHGNSELCSVDGQKVSFSDYQRLTKGRADLPFIEWNALSPELLLVRFFRTKYSFINHSRKPNCATKITDSGVSVFAIQNISKNEELTLDYRREPLPEEYLFGHGASHL